VGVLEDLHETGKRLDENSTNSFKKGQHFQKNRKLTRQWALRGFYPESGSDYSVFKVETSEKGRVIG